MLAASILDAFWMTHLHYCQRTTASENWFLRPAGYDLETDRKRDKWVNGKALNRKKERPNKFTSASLGSWQQWPPCSTVVHDTERILLGIGTELMRRSGAA